MIEIPQKIEERALLVALIKGNVDSEIVKEHLDELEELSSTAGAETVRKIIQTKYAADPAFYIGKGKAEELVNIVEDDKIDVVIFDDDLSPTQVRNLQRTLNRKIIDRSGLILDIFASRAKTKEAKTQVELAQLQYLLPRLTRAWTHLSKQYGGIGTKGPGETQIETDRRIIRTKISQLKQNLKKIESQRNTQTQGRKDFIRVCLAGYTNAGKSTLFNRLTESGVFAEDKLFATLDSTTRAFEFEKNKKILMNDTVGFIRKLPHHLVASFKSTLNVVGEADIILHIIDVSHEYFEDHILTVEETLKDLDSEKKYQIKVFNKIDALVDKHKLEYITHKYQNALFISAERGIGITQLKEKLLEVYEKNYGVHQISFNHADSKLISKVYDLAEVLESNYNDENVILTYRADVTNHNLIIKLIKTNNEK